MPEVIYKYPIPLMDAAIIRMPGWAEILHVADQGGIPCLWAKVDPSQPIRDYHFRVFGTGQPLPDLHAGPGTRFLGTVLSGRHVWHIYQQYTAWPGHPGFPPTPLATEAP